VIAQSVLCTFEGSSLNNAGQMAIARLPPRSALGASQGGLTPWNNLYQYLSDLPVHNYNGPTKKGSYSWYLSTDEQGYFYGRSSRNTNVSDSYICMECTTSDVTNTALRLMVNTVVQFCTTSNAFAQCPSDFIGNDIEKIRHMLSNIPASYENPTHRQQLTNFLKGTADKVYGAIKNPAFYKGILDNISNNVQNVQGFIDKNKGAMQSMGALAAFA